MKDKSDYEIARVFLATMIILYSIIAIYLGWNGALK